MRSIALAVHRDFCEGAIKDGAVVRSAGRLKTNCAELELSAQSLAPDDQVALEATGPALQIKRLLEPHVGRVVIANTRKLRAIAEAKVKTTRSTRGRFASCLRPAFCPRSSAPTKRRGRSGAGWRAAPRWSASAPGRRTSSTRCWPATCRADRR